METPAGLVKIAAGRSLAARLGAGLLDLVYPPVCLACDAPVGTPDTLCPVCFVKLRAITAPLCPVLGLPFETSLGPDARSAEAIADPPPFDRARSAVVYGEIAGALVGRLKYGDRPEIARFCGRLMAGAGHELWASDAVLVPIPLHAGRLFARRYNQSTELARVLSRLTGLPLANGLLRRKRATRQQVGLSGAARRRNLAGAFVASPLVAGRRIILVDDVITTGSTVKAATRALRSSGVAAVDIISFARVVTGHVEVG